MSVPVASSVFVPPFTAHSAPIGGAPKTSTPRRPSFTISRTYIVPSRPKARSMTDVNPVATVRHGPTFGLAGSQVAPAAPGSIRQMRDLPGGNGKPFSSDTYQAPSGPMATAVGTASTGNGSPGSTGPGNGRPEGHGTSSGLKRATVVIFRRVSTFKRSLPAASVTRTPPP